MRPLKTAAVLLWVTALAVLWAAPRPVGPRRQRVNPPRAVPAALWRVTRLHYAGAEYAATFTPSGSYESYHPDSGDGHFIGRWRPVYAIGEPFRVEVEEWRADAPGPLWTDPFTPSWSATLGEAGPGLNRLLPPRRPAPK